MEKDEKGRLIINKPLAIAMIVAAVILLAVIATLSVFLGMTRSENQKWLTQANSKCQEAYYDLVDEFLNMETNLSKLRVVTSDGLRQQLLLDIAMSAESAVCDLSAISSGDHDLSDLIKYCNQVGDYCKYAFKKISNGSTLSSEEEQTLSELYDMTYSIAKGLTSISAQLTSSGDFVLGLGKVNEGFSDMLLQFNNGSVKYPSLIYDGAFSDSLVNKAPKMITGDDIDPNQARAYIVKALSGYELSDYTFAYQNDNKFSTYFYDFKTKSGESGTIEIAKQGGMTIMWNIDSAVDNPVMSKDQGVLVAEQYCRDIGLDNMKAVWACVSNSMLYVNLCWQKNGVICYPDMVKIKVSLQSGKVVGYEALNYCYNHDDSRSIGTVGVSMETVQSYDYRNLQVESIRLALIPTDGGEEILTYEVYGKMDKYTFYVYLDATDGKQIKILQVIDSDEGELLM
ncbi:MAG: PepSY1/2 domain-containing protein [Christensenellales bacterium]